MVYTLIIDPVFIVACMVGIGHPVGIVLFVTASIANVSVERLSLTIRPFVLRSS